MNITFQNQTNRTDSVPGYPDHAETRRITPGKDSRKAAGEAVNVSFSAADSNLNRFCVLGEEKAGRENGKSITELQQEASVTDVGISQDYMTLMSNTMSAEDYQKLSRDGFDFSSMDPEEAVTIVDKIKAELVRSGKQIAGYTDDIDMETLTAAVGSETLARALADRFQAADIPMTKENMDAAGRAWTMARDLKAPTEEVCQYMADNEMEPEIWNFYLAQNSGADCGASSHGAADQDKSYLADENIQKQIEQVLIQAGYEASEENRKSAEWLLERNLPLTEDSIRCLKNLQDAVVPVTEEDFAQAAADAIASGKDPIHASLAGKDQAGKTIYEKAVEVMDYYQTLDIETLDIGTLSARKQLEEIRLRMTAEINVKLLKSGFSIDTAPMEDLIKVLREAEKTIAGQYFPEDAGAVEKYENWNETNRIMQEIPELPAQLLGTVRIGVAGEEDGTVLSRFHEEGVALRQAYEKAGEQYETLMTVPRTDLGDSMQKAFGNVEELVRGLGLDAVEENYRAVRILGYNRMEITAENVERVRTADAQVQELVGKMTPAATLQMIRDGVNPLEQSFDQLNDYFENQPEDFQKQAESYSRYLYGLEQNNQISEQERDSYIGVYRLLHQIERRDGAAIGAVINEQAELQFANLLSAVRSGKFRHMDVRATDELSMLKEMVRKGEGRSISDQISQGFARAQLAQLRSVTETNSEAVAMLERGELPASAENLLAAQKFTANEVNPYKALKKKPGDLWEQIAEKSTFRAEYEESVSEMQEETEEIALTQASSSLDVRSMQLVHRQLSIMGSLSRQEEYFLPMEMGGDEALVHLTFESGGSEKGGIFIEVDYGQDAHLEAHLQVKNNQIEGFLLGKTSSEVTKLQETSDIFYNLINENASMDLEAAKLPVVNSRNIKMTRMSESNSREDTNSPDNGMLYRVAKLFLQAIR